MQYSRSVVSDSLRPHESQHARPPCPSPTPGVDSDSHPLSQWCKTNKQTNKKSVMPSSHLILCRPLLLLPPITPSIRVFSNESILRMRWPKYCSFSFSNSPSKEHPGLISIMILDEAKRYECLIFFQSSTQIGKQAMVFYINVYPVTSICYFTIPLGENKLLESN